MSEGFLLMVDLKFSKEIYKFFANLIFQESGIVYAEEKYYQLNSKLISLASKLGMEDVPQMYEKYKQGMDSKMKQELIDVGTNNETSFYRSPATFKALAENYLPEFVKTGKTPLKIWSAASSRGQESYTIAMVIKEKFPHLKFSIDATDICHEALEYAKRGRYTNLECQRGLKIERQLKYFSQDQDENHWTIKDEFRSIPKFKYLNLHKDQYKLKHYDLIFLRNVLIYFTESDRVKIINKVKEALAPEGYLILGTGETLKGLDIDLKPKKFPGDIWWQKE